LFAEPSPGVITDIAYAIDNTTKTRALFEISKGSNTNLGRENKCRAFSHPLDDKESFFEFAKLSSSSRSLACAVSQYAQQCLCSVLDDYPPRLYWTSNGPIELPELDADNAIGRGIRSRLYYFLRLEYLRFKGRLGLGICRHCEEVFVKERRGAVYCGNGCSHNHRSLTYYYEQGRAKRQARLAQISKEPVA
jgi:hypothetical protein